MEWLPIVLVVLIWPLSFMKRRPNWVVPIGGLLSVYFLITSFLLPEYRWVCLLFAFICGVNSIHTYRRNQAA